MPRCIREPVLAVVVEIPLCRVSWIFLPALVLNERLSRVVVVERNRSCNFLLDYVGNFRHNIGAISAVPIVESLFLEDYDDHTFWDESDKSASSVDDGEGVMGGLKCLFARLHV